VKISTEDQEPLKKKPHQVHMTAGKWQDFPQAQKVQSNYSHLDCDAMYCDVQVL
jgi:hypothetical protein